MFKKIIFIIFLPVISLVFWVYNLFIIDDNLSFLFTDYIFVNLSGVLAISFMSVNFLLASRLDFVEKIFGGYDKVYKWHLYVARIVGVMIILHPLLIILYSSNSLQSFLRSAIYYFIPNLANNNLALFYGIISFWGVNLLVFLTLFAKLPYHIWKNTHRLFIVFFVTASLHSFLKTGNEMLIYKIWLIALISIGILSFVYREIIYHFLKSKVYKIKDLKYLNNVVEITLDDDSKKFEFHPGQFVFLSVINNKNISSELHPFTISSAPGENLRFSVKYLGDWTQTLSQLKQDQEIKIWGPHGRFFLDDQNNYLTEKNKTIICIGGGIGITPFLSIARYLVNSSKTVGKLYVLYSTKNKQEAVYESELNSLENDQIKVFNHYSEEMGYIDEKFLKENFGENLEIYRFMLCGPTPMIKSLIKILKANNVKQDQIYYEEFSFK